MCQVNLGKNYRPGSGGEENGRCPIAVRPAAPWTARLASLTSYFRPTQEMKGRFLFSLRLLLWTCLHLQRQASELGQPSMPSCPLISSSLSFDVSCQLRKQRCTSRTEWVRGWGSLGSVPFYSVSNPCGCTQTSTPLLSSHLSASRSLILFGLALEWGTVWSWSCPKLLAHRLEVETTPHHGKAAESRLGSSRGAAGLSSPPVLRLTVSHFRDIHCSLFSFLFRSH